MQFRGPGSRGVDDAATFPERWGDGENIRWAKEIAGRGYSSPIVAGDRIYLTTVTRESGEPEPSKPGLYFLGERPLLPNVQHDWQLLCLDLNTGEQLWSTSLHKGLPKTPRHIKNSYASETPVTDGENIYVLFGDVGLYCVSKAGDVVWEHELPPVPTRLGWGTASSPILYGDRLYFVSDNDESSYVAAVDKASGEFVWKVSRDEKSNWSTPYIWKNSLRTELITPGTKKVRSYDLDGNLLYEFGGCSSITIATPYSVGDLLYVSSGYVGDKARPLFAIKPGASGDISLQDDETKNQFIQWCQPQGAPYNPSTLAYGDLVYVLKDRGITTAFDATTGQEVHKPARISGGRSFTASPWASRDRIYFLNEFGTTFVYQAGDDFKLLHQNELPDDSIFMATPTVAGDKLLIRSRKKLYCIQSQ